MLLWLLFEAVPACAGMTFLKIGVFGFQTACLSVAVGLFQATCVAAPHTLLIF
ncbi:disulfide bond formation protein DsbB [Neisseria bacilliformis ATCC BAA-1200]|uniref:Disulfide bond formation protein DsbB n=1 Tax=Neisseria bacilliformis ATCC BAA-1200 TaxID=888742 RepID=F2BB00_9NEIS|nr:disulfide bond formation protein DsbB [Neisseria bacilliformis ATCC BAA-1200]